VKGHTRRRGKTWAFVIDIGLDPATGKRRQKWVSGFELERDAATAMRDYIARMERGEAVSESGDTVASYLRDEWLPSRRSKVKESTWSGHKDAIDGRIIPALGGLPLRRVTPKHIAKLYDTLLESGSWDEHRGPGLAPKTVRNTGLVLKKAFGDAGRLAVRRALVSVRYKVSWSSPKTAKSARVIALDPATCDVLRAHRARQTAEKALVGDAYNDDDLVFAKPDGSWLHPDYVSQRFERLVKKAGLPMIRPHDTRHTAATLLLEAGIPVKVVSERLGHSTTSITADIYQHVAPHMQEEAANKLGAMLLGEPEPKAEG